MGISKENLDELIEMRRRLDQARATNMGINPAERRFMNCLYRNYMDLVTTAREVEKLKEELAAVKEERDLFEDTLARQDKELHELRENAKPKTRTKQG